MKFVFYGRVSTEDAQDPSLSLPRQLAACERAIETAGGELVGFYWDIESGRKNLADRGTGADGNRFGVTLRRDGGLPQLLAAAANGRSFDAVIVESIDRLSRMTADATRIERDLEQRDIALFASDEPMNGNATSILTRRVKQGVAEWYVRDLIEKSRRGMEESVRQGWHTGGPAPYGYQLQPHEHPNPQKAREGRKKHRLLLDPVKAPIVRMIFEDYCLSGLGLGAICDKLNADLVQYPPPTRNKKDENDLAQTWSRSQLQAMLRNPKYTGYNVWGRHDKRAGRPCIRPRDQWIWSPTRLTTRSSTERSSSRSRSARSETTAAPCSRRPRTTCNGTAVAPGGSTRSAAASTAASAAAGWKAATRKAPTGTAASSSTAAASPPPTPPDTPACSASAKRSSSSRYSTSSDADSSGPNASASSTTNSRTRSPPSTTPTQQNSPQRSDSSPTSTRPYAAKPYASKNTTTPTTPSSPQPKRESRSWQVNEQHSETCCTNSKRHEPTHRSPRKSKRYSPPSPTYAPRSPTTTTPSSPTSSTPSTSPSPTTSPATRSSSPRRSPPS